jgi:hypothetical protein
MKPSNLQTKKQIRLNRAILGKGAKPEARLDLER